MARRPESIPSLRFLVPLPLGRLGSELLHLEQCRLGIRRHHGCLLVPARGLTSDLAVMEDMAKGESGRFVDQSFLRACQLTSCVSTCFDCFERSRICEELLR